MIFFLKVGANACLLVAGVAVAVFAMNGSSNQGLSALSVGAWNQDQDEDVDVEALMEDGQQKVGEGDFKGAAEVFRKVVAADKNNGLGWQMLGYSLHMDKKYDEAIEAHTKASTFRDYKAIGLYNLACAWSLKKDTEKAIGFFEKAVEAGFNDSDLIDGDSDLDHIRKDGRFEPIAKWARTGKRPGADSKAIQGKWVVTSGSKAGERYPMEEHVPEFEFTAKQIFLPGPEGTERFVMNYTVDSSKSPMQIDMEIESGPAPEGKAVGIIKVDEGKLTLCYDPTGAKRPEKFTSDADNGFFLFESKKAVATFDAAVLKGEWVLVSGVKAGEELGEDHLSGSIKFDADTVTIPAGEESFVMGYKIDPSATPAIIDMKILSGPAPEGSPAFGIIKKQDENVVICYNAMGEDRPEKFESTEENGFFLFTLKPAKK